VNKDSDIVTLLEDPLVRVDMSLLTIRDFINLATNKDGTHGLTVLEKCLVDDANISIDYLLTITTAIGNEVRRVIEDTVEIKKMMGR
jgi:hypothetical protein